MLATAPVAAISPLQISFLTMSLSMRRGSLSRTRWGTSLRPGLEAVAHGLDDHRAKLVEVLVDQLEDPARKELLDRAVEPHRGDQRVHVRTERSLRLAVGDD